MLYIPVNEALPKYVENCAFVYIKLKDGRIRKGMFYKNGGKPTFASYGAEIKIEDIQSWAYR